MSERSQNALIAAGIITALSMLHWFVELMSSHPVLWVLAMLAIWGVALKLAAPIYRSYR